MAGINDIDIGMQNLIKMTSAKATITKLWENASPGSSFSPQKLAVNTSDYDMLVYVCNLNTTYNQRFVPWAMTVLGNSAFCIYTNIGRTMTWESKTTIDIGGTSTGKTTDIIPCYIYGIKLSGGVRLKTYLQRLKTLYKYARRCLLWQLA